MAKETNDAKATKAEAKAVKKQSDKPKKAPRQGVAKRISRYFKDLSGEIKKVVWPSKEQVKNNTIVVMVFCLIAAIFVCSLDVLLSILVQLLIQHEVNLF